MLRVAACLTQQHDLRLVVLAVLLCGIGCYTSVSLLAHAARGDARGSRLWLIATAAVFGSSVWAMHFIAMLAFQPHLPVHYDMAVTALSIIVVVLGSLPGFVIVLAWRGRAQGWATGGAVIGLAVAAMHYTGMSALRLPGVIRYDAAYVVASMAVGVTLAAAALAVAGSLSDRRRRAGAALLLTLAIAGLHFTAMAAVVIEPGLIDNAIGAIRSPLPLAAALAAVILGIVLISLTAALFVDRLNSRAVAEVVRIQQLADAAFEGLAIRRGGIILGANRALGDLLGVPPAALIGRKVQDFVASPYIELVERRFAVVTDEVAEIELILSDGSQRAVEVLSRPIEYDGRPAVITAVRDISERKHAEHRIRHLALHDVLTDLPNRVLLNDRIKQALNATDGDAESLAVLCLDLDRFKAVNDLFGHQTGDQLLAQVADRLCNAVRSDDTVARLGGDEFAIVQPLGRQPGAASGLAERVINTLSQPFEVSGQQVVIGASVGVAIYPESGRSAADLLKNADAALYRAKRDGRGVFRVFEPAMDAELQARRRLERDLRQAIHGGGLQLHYQPLFDCQSGAVLGFEALLRWMHPEHGAIPPAEFVPMAEECGLIGPLGRFVLETACAEAVSWAKPYCIAVNLSPAQFRSHDLVETVAATLRRSGLRPERLELEITEGVLIDNAERALALLKQLKSLGIRIALDDFGTGYSSLSYLRLFPFDKLKIDRSFVQGLGEEGSEAGGSMAIISAILAMARSLRLDVTAEGVETVRQLELLRTQHCGQVQGFLLGRPTPANQLHPFLAAAHPAATDHTAVALAAAG